MPLLDDKGVVVGTTGYSRDITGRKQAEETMQRSEQAARLAADQSRMVNQIGLQMTAGLNSDQLLQTIYEQCQQVGDTDAFYLALYDVATDTISAPFYYNDGHRYNIPVRNASQQPGLVGHPRNPPDPSTSPIRLTCQPDSFHSRGLARSCARSWASR